MLSRAERTIRGLLILVMLFGAWLAVTMTDVPALGLAITAIAAFVFLGRVTTRQGRSTQHRVSQTRRISSAQQALQEVDYSRERADRGAADSSLNYFNEGGSPTAESYNRE